MIAPPIGAGVRTCPYCQGWMYEEAPYIWQCIDCKTSMTDARYHQETDAEMMERDAIYQHLDEERQARERAASGVHQTMDGTWASDYDGSPAEPPVRCFVGGIRYDCGAPNPHGEPMRTAGPRETSVRMVQTLVDIERDGRTMQQVERITRDYTANGGTCWMDGDRYQILGVRSC